jgi:hypothetical protein
MQKIHPTAYAIYGIPSIYANQSWDDIDLPKPERERLEKAFANPIPSVVHIQGTAAPVVNSLILSGKSVYGININDRLTDAFGDHTNSKADVVLIHNIGSYTGKFEIASNVLKQIIQHYRNLDTLVLLQSNESWTYLRDNYGVAVVNKVKLPLAKEQAWV